MDVREYLTADGRNPYPEVARHTGHHATGPHSGEGAPLLDLESRRPQERGRRRLGGASRVRAGVSIYFGKDGAQLVLLLLGGDKSTQAADVARAQESWKPYQEGKRRGKTK